MISLRVVVTARDLKGLSHEMDLAFDVAAILSPVAELIDP
jgi:hypothetical protein